MAASTGVKASSFGTGANRSLLSERVPAKLAVFMAVRAVFASEMTFTAGLAT